MAERMRFARGVLHHASTEDYDHPWTNVLPSEVDRILQAAVMPGVRLVVISGDFTLQGIKANVLTVDDGNYALVRLED